MRAWHILVVVVALCGLLEYQLFNLSSRVDTLRQIVQGLSAADAMDQMQNKQGNAAALSKLQESVKKLTTRVDRLQLGLPSGSINTTTSDPGAATNGEPGDMFSDKVLSVIRSEVERIRDIQLKRNRDALVKYRKAAVREFAIKQGLTAGQESAIQTILEDEVDRMVEVLRDVDWENASPTFLTEWNAMLAQTNDKVQDILSPDQMAIFLYLRHLEQQAMQVWLPKSI